MRIDPLPATAPLAAVRLSTDEPMRIAMIADYPRTPEDHYRGGLLQASYRLASALGRRNDVRLHVIAPGVADESRDDGPVRVHFFRPRNPGFDTLLGYAGLRGVIRGLLREIDPEVVHAQGTPAYIRAAIESGLPSVVTIHGVYRNELKVNKTRPSLKTRIANGLVVATEESNFRRIRTLIAITPEIERLVRERAPRVHIFRIPNAIDAGFFEVADTSSRPQILFCGFVSHRKGVHVLLEAFGRVRSAVPGARLRIAGIDAVEPDYAARLKQEFAAEDIDFLGGIPQEQLYDEIGACTLLCLPSFAESAPMVISQAMAAGKPVVATRVGGIPAMVDEGATGRLVEPGDSDGLAAALVDLLSDDVGRRRMGEAARQVAHRRHHPDEVAAATMQVYEGVLAGRA